MHTTAGIYANKYNIKEAIKYLTKSLQIAREILDQYKIVISLVNLGLMHIKSLNFNLALEYLNEALELSEKSNYTRELELCNNYILEINKYLLINDNPIIIDKNSTDKEDIIRYLIDTANQLKEKKQYNEAEEKLNEAQNLADSINLKGSQAEVYIAYYDYYKTIENKEKAKEYYNKANYIIKNSNHLLFAKRLKDIKLN
jgi:tetratricopeptide (TPR) repeat protein